MIDEIVDRVQNLLTISLVPVSSCNTYRYEPGCRCTVSYCTGTRYSYEVRYSIIPVLWYEPSTPSRTSYRVPGTCWYSDLWYQDRLGVDDEIQDRTRNCITEGVCPLITCSYSQGLERDPQLTNPKASELLVVVDENHLNNL
jgi:hypothetical protein